ncbi:T9SS type A sorting domain-containing protein [Hymenobacter metallicola]|nr:T9SS type A sorting domain-containing protein [Hymenobacter metallicola]
MPTSTPAPKSPSRQRLRWAIGLLVLLQLYYLPQSRSQGIDQVQLVGTATSTGGSTVRSSVTDSNGNLYVMGDFSGSLQLGSTSLTSAGSLDFYVAKISPDGQWQWAVRGGGTDADRPLKIALDPSGLLRVTGRFASPTLALGSTTLTGNSYNTYFVAQLTTDGVWQTAFTVPLPAATSGTNAYDIAIDAGGNAIITGVFLGTVRFGTSQLTVRQPSPGHEDIFVAKLSPQGAWLWAYRAGSYLPDAPVAVAVDAADNVYLTGNISASADFGPFNLYPSSGGASDNADIFVAKLSSAGAWLWAKNAGGDWYDTCGGMTLDAAGNMYVTGRYSTARGMSGGASFGNTVLPDGAGGDDLFVAKVSAAGVWQWANRAGSSGNELGTSVTLDTQGNVYVGGNFSNTCAFGSYTCTTLGGNDAFIAKLNPTGAWQWGFGCGTTGNDVATTVAVNPQGRVYLGGNLPTAVSFGTPSQTLAAPKGFIARVAEQTTLSNRPGSAWAASISLYPNPVTNYITLKLPAPAVAQQIQATVYNALGQLVRTQPLQLPAGATSLKVAVDGMRPGTYTLQLQAAKEVVVRRFSIH